MRPSTFSMSDKIEAIAYPIIFAPFFGAKIPIKLRELTQAQIMSCGDFSLIETFHDKVVNKSKQISPEALLKNIDEYSKANHNVAKLSLVSPTYDEIIGIIKKCEIKDIENELKIAKEKLRSAPAGKIKQELETEILKYDILLNLILPEDFLNFIVAYALGIDKSDIKLISEKMLIESALLAEKGHNNPADHIHGRFTDFMKDDINKRAWLLLAEEREKRKGK